MQQLSKRQIGWEVHASNRVEQGVTGNRSPLKAKILSSECLLSQEILHHIQKMSWGELQSGAMVNQIKDGGPVGREGCHNCNRGPASAYALFYQNSIRRAAAEWVPQFMEAV